MKISSNTKFPLSPNLDDDKKPRFFLTGPLVGGQNHTYFNFFRDDEELRQVFGAVFIEALRVGHHISVKCPDDPPSPPFADVTATYIADNIDRLERGFISPCVVRVNGH